MSRHVLQYSLDSLSDYLADARRIYEIIGERNANLATERRNRGNRTGAGPPPANHRSLNRAVVVASVGALEAFTEDLALRALPLVPEAQTTDTWFDIAGRRGMVQTPNSQNIAKMYWAYFRYDPRLDWDILVTTAWSEMGKPNATNWRGTTKKYPGPDAAAALDAMVKVRHGFAHQDLSNAPKATPGIVSLTPGGKLSLQSHHAFNSMSLVAQVAVQMTQGLSLLIPSSGGKIKWKKIMTDGDLERLLSDTPAATIVKDEWIGSPW